MRMIATLIACAVLSFLPVNVHAQSYPKQPINLLIPLAPGDATDVAGRTIGARSGGASLTIRTVLKSTILKPHPVPASRWFRRSPLVSPGCGR